MKKCSFLLLAAIFYSTALLAADIPLLPEFKPDDRVLVMAPHPDDEIIATGGLIQRALKAGAKVKVLLYTNGESNELAFIAYEKRIIFKKKAFLHMGNIRHRESVNACALLGVKSKDIYTLGYPDFGTLEIFTKYWGKTKPFRSMLPRDTHVSYRQAMSPNAPFVGESILNDIKNVIRQYKPTKIFASHPIDTNRDHKALYLFTRVALWDLQKESLTPKFYPYLIHVVGWPRPRGFKPHLELKPFHKLKSSEIRWQQIVLTDEEIKLKRDAVMLFPSQNQPNTRYLMAFVRKNELYGDYPDIILKSQDKDSFVWQNVGHIERYTRTSLLEKRELASAVAYASAGDYLCIRLITKVPLSKNFGVLVYLLGYKDGVDFAAMPKIALSVNVSGVHLKDGRRLISSKSVDFTHKGNQLVFKVPLKALGSPDKLFASPRILMGKLPLDKIAWRILRLE